MRRETLTRREAAVGLAALGGAAAAQSAGAQGERVRLAFIGVGNRGSQLLSSALRHPWTEVAALCDVYEPYLARAIEKLGKRVPSFMDFRKVLDRNDVDAVVIATPDHWP
ncbi:MAG: hypothetical protein FJX72_04240, partial [Armatimonadetes bacterium]|nr:hypothetical protein [Armatimonadota bacterium]